MTAQELLNYLVQLQNEGKDLSKLEVKIDGCGANEIDHDEEAVWLLS